MTTLQSLIAAFALFVALLLMATFATFARAADNCSYQYVPTNCPCYFWWTYCDQQPPDAWPYYGRFDYCKPNGQIIATKYDTKAELNAQFNRFSCYVDKCTNYPNKVCG